MAFIIDPFILLALFGVTIIVGYLGQLLFHKTHISDIIWLLAFGLIVSHAGWVDRSLFLVVSPFLASLAILLILFDAGLNMDFYQMVRGAPRGMLLAAVGFLFEVAAVAAVAFYFIRFDLATSLLLGAILGGTSTPVVIALVSKTSASSRVKTILSLESVFTDPLVIVAALAVMNFIVAGLAVSPLQSVLSSFSIGAVVGLFLGLVWLFVLDRLKGKPFDYMLTLAILFLIFVIVENSGGSGAIAALTFGLVLGNGHSFSKMLRFRKRFGVSSLLKQFQAEVSFFIRSFFFVYLGIIAVISTTFLVYGLAIAAAALLIRLVAVQISAYRMAVTRKEKNIMRVMAPKGLAAAVLAQLPITFGLANAEAIANVVFVVILATVIYTTIMVELIDRHGHGKKNKNKSEG